MAVVFDTEQLPVADRIEATVCAMQEQSVPSTVILHPDAAVRSRMEVWDYGAAAVFQADMTGFRLQRTIRQIKANPGRQLGIALHDNCIGRQEQNGDQRLVPPGALMVTDHNAPYTYQLDGHGTPYCLFVPIDALGLPAEVVREAASRLRASPIHDLMVDHISDLTRQADRLSASPVAGQLGDTSIELSRALLASAYDVHYARGMMAEVLLPRLRAHIRAHLADPALSPQSIASAHGISVRKLFRVFADAGVSVEQWIVAGRLEGARADLVRPETRHLPVAVIARNWGFTNPSHFSKRFRVMYGMSPRAWRNATGDGKP
ncbi:helix-turn-helix domain-containing protein [Gordonia sp. NPDC003424]